MSNYSINCTSIEEIDETSTEYIITQVFGWATGILALVKVFFNNNNFNKEIYKKYFNCICYNWYYWGNMCHNIWCKN